MTYCPPTFFLKKKCRCHVACYSKFRSSGGRKISIVSFFPKQPNFIVISTQKHLTNTFGTPINQSINLKYSKNGLKTQNQIGLDLFTLT